MVGDTMELGGVGKEWGDTCTSMGILIMGTCISCTRTSLHELASQLGLTCNFMQVNNYLPRVCIQAYIHVHVHLVTDVILVILTDVEFYSKHVSVLHIQYTTCTCIYVCIHELLSGPNLRINFSIREEILVVKKEVPVVMQHIMQCIWPKSVVDFLSVMVRQNN